jgi:spore coat protein CotF
VRCVIKLTGLYEQWQSDLKSIDRRWRDFMKTDEAFHEAIDTLEAITPQVKKSLSNSLKSLSSTVPEIKASLTAAIDNLTSVTPGVKKTLNQAIHQSFVHARDQLLEDMNQRLDQALSGQVSRLEQSVHQTTNEVNGMMASARRQLRFFSFKVGFLSVFSSLAVGFFFCAWLTNRWFPDHLTRFSGADLNRVEASYDLDSITPFLTTTERKKVRQWIVNGYLNRRGWYHPKKRSTQGCSKS